MSSSDVGPGDASQLIDLLLGAADFSPVEVVTPSLPDQLEAAMGLQRLQPGHQSSTPPDSSRTVPPPCGPYSQVSSPSRFCLGDVSDVVYQSSTMDADRRQTPIRMVHQAQQREIDLAQIFATLLETPRPQLVVSMFQSIR